MKLKKDKELFLAELECDVKCAIQQAFYVDAPTYYGQQVSVNFNELISRAVAAGVQTAMAKLIEDQYTDEDFERDIGLKD